MSYADRLKGIAERDAEVLFEKDKEYGGSWLKRGGVGAFMMLCRKWDRIETQVDKRIGTCDDPGLPADRFDIIGHALSDQREEGILDDIGDLRRYLLLVEAEVRERMEEKLFEKRTCETCSGEYKAHRAEDERRHCPECVRPNSAQDQPS